ncbi:YqzE family protein [Paenibacillus gallinarum]|uniref:YqzE family protein n=1 Tax=Paenibacillus gallinarum TaxID=2762232 RepID=A0ABR8SUC8_9BACL|nr:YqzE family protein [Paenibacillus gallinarum]MBD7967097.1 YqzE family protein [Paenibacillus gallinarum]
MAKGNDLIRYITEQVVEHMEKPKEERKSSRKRKEPWQTKWFGMLPFGVSMWASEKKKEVRSKKKNQNTASDS